MLCCGGEWCARDVFEGMVNQYAPYKTKSQSTPRFSQCGPHEQRTQMQ